MTRAGMIGLGFVIVLVFLPVRAMSQGGPPLITDDPDTPGPGYWEINVAAIVEKSRQARRIEGPLADINYGVGKTIQLKVEVPWLTVHETGQLQQAGIGNFMFGVKWRFLGHEGKTISWSIYPQVEGETSDSSAEKGLVDKGASFLMPTELTFQKGKLEINGEVGRIFAQDGGNGWIAGVTTEIEFPRGFELLGEFHSERTHPDPAEHIVNIGVRKQLTSQIVLLAAGGRAVHDAPGQSPFSRLYAGLQFNLPHQYTGPATTHP